MWPYAYHFKRNQFEYAYYAGLLGMPSKHLILKGWDNYKFNWILNESGLPEKMEYIHIFGKKNIVKFTW